MRERKSRSDRLHTQQRRSASLSVTARARSVSSLPLSLREKLISPLRSRRGEGVLCSFYSVTPTISNLARRNPVFWAPLPPTASIDTFCLLVAGCHHNFTPLSVSFAVACITLRGAIQGTTALRAMEAINSPAPEWRLRHDLPLKEMVEQEAAAWTTAKEVTQSFSLSPSHAQKPSRPTARSVRRRFYMLSLALVNSFDFVVVHAERGTRRRCHEQAKAEAASVESTASAEGVL